MTIILVTGGAGYVGSHTVVQLIQAGYQVVILDNLVNSKISVIDRIEKITGTRPAFIQGDINDDTLLNNIIKKYRFDSVMHFAGLKSVAESEKEPLKYFYNNVGGSIKLFEILKKAGIKKVLFSSSATVYGHTRSFQYREDAPLNPINTYGQTKLMVENILRNLKKLDSSLSVAILRYFNPVGAHKSGLIGDDPDGIPNNLMPYISQVAIGLRKKLFIYGNDYPTRDGTGLRDYIHIEDLAKGHLAALKKIEEKPEFITVNLGTGKTVSVLELVNIFSKVSGRDILYEISNRRPGDLAEYYADPSLAKDLLNWTAEFGIESMCEDHWRWQNFHKAFNGY
jgi:UDP-glucose 4-epimerase